MKKESVTVVGLGYMGLPTALFLAKFGHAVHGFDTNTEKVAKINAGECIFNEPGLKELMSDALKSGRFSVSDRITPSEVYIIAVPTPEREHTCDLSHVMSAVSFVASVAKDGDLIIIESTIKPGTCTNQIPPIFKEKGVNVDIVHCPERALPGNTFHEIVHNDRIIGGMTRSSALRAKRLYASFVQGEIVLTDLKIAETVKLMENTYRDVNIALANEFSILADELGFNLWEAIRLANRHPRVQILQPGPGVGGHCIAVDPWFLTEGTNSARVIVAARNVNDGMPEVVVHRLYTKVGSKQKLKIGILGLAYKKNVDDTRETPAEHIIRLFEKDGHEVHAHDPYVKNWPTTLEPDLKVLEKWADAFVLVTDHDVYRTFKTKKPVLDTRNFLRPI